MSRIFVYGSLKRDKSAHQFLKENNAVFIKEAVTKPQYSIYHISWFPGMVMDAHHLSQGVHGEVYEVNARCLEQLDRYEGAPSLFRRDTVVLSDGDEVIAYFYNQSLYDSDRIETGVWDG